MTQPSRPIIVVTGANNGVGFGICHRILLQLSSSAPSDAHLPSEATTTDDGISLPCQGLTLIMACRNAKRAEAARQKLYTLLDTHIAAAKLIPSYEGHAERFRDNLTVEIELIDLAMISSVFAFTQNIKQKYPYVSHLIFNAGGATFTGINWPLAVKQVLTEPLEAVTSPAFYLQSQGDVSMDGLGWTWQTNLFSHFVIYRELESHLGYAYPARVIWTSSLEARDEFFSDMADYQLRNTLHAYEGSKYQTDLLACTLESQNAGIRHLIAHPGICHSGISAKLLFPVVEYLKLIAFYIGRWFLSSPHHTITPFKAAVSVVYLALIPLTMLTSTKPVRHGAETDWKGTERVGYHPVREWEKNVGLGKELLTKCDELYRSLKTDRSKSPQYETASERM